MMQFLFSFVALLILSGSVFSHSYAYTTESTQPSLEKGAITFNQRCTLCHGSIGMGEGLLPMAIKNYPSTNLLDPKIALDEKSLRELIIWGGIKGKATAFSPPWGDELTWTEIESIILFVNHLRSDTENAIALLKRHRITSVKPSIKIGSSIFKGRCKKCHGSTGKGDGKMAKIIKNPPPFNLTASVMPDAYLREIISKGGAAMGRSQQMPPWGNELSATELESIILYIKTFRSPPISAP